MNWGRGIKIYLFGYMAQFFTKNPDIYKPVTSRVFKNHTLSINFVFDKYTTHYVFASLFKEHIIKNKIQTTSRVVDDFLFSTTIKK
jgi:hypothetical protein